MIPRPLNQRFRGFLPVVIDVETAGFNAKTDALLELAAVFLSYNVDYQLTISHSVHYHIEPFKGANLERSALEFIGIDPYHPFRFAITESEAMKKLCDATKSVLKTTQCTRAILVGHNAHFDLGFLQAALMRTHMKSSPFHSFSTLDTATLSALAYGQTVLAKGLQAAGIAFDPDLAHGALYDAEKTAELFCKVINKWESLVALT